MSEVPSTENVTHDTEKNFFLTRFSVLVIVINFIGFKWAIDPQSFGFYVGMFFIPINFLLMVGGLIRVWFIRRKTPGINYLKYYGVVMLVPGAAQLVLFLLIEIFARKGGC